MTGNTTNEFLVLPRGDEEEWLKAQFGEYAEGYREAVDGKLNTKIVGFDVCEKLMWK